MRFDYRTLVELQQIGEMSSHLLTDRLIPERDEEAKRVFSGVIRHTFGGACYAWDANTTSAVSVAYDRITHFGFEEFLSTEWPAESGIHWMDGSMFDEPKNDLGFGWSLHGGIERPNEIAIFLMNLMADKSLNILNVSIWRRDERPDALAMFFDYEDDERAVDERATYLGKTMVVINSFLRDHIVMRTPGVGAVTRQQRKRMEPESLDRLSVITLRHPRRDGSASNETTGRDWRSRWLVSGHWRNQWYPSMQMHARKWIPPYVKGPEDKPFVRRDKVYAVVR